MGFEDPALQGEAAGNDMTFANAGQLTESELLNAVSEFPELETIFAYVQEQLPHLEHQIEPTGPQPSKQGASSKELDYADLSMVQQLLYPSHKDLVPNPIQQCQREAQVINEQIKIIDRQIQIMQRQKDVNRAYFLKRKGVELSNKAEKKKRSKVKAASGDKRSIIAFEE